MRIETPSANLRFYSELQDVDRPMGVDMTLAATSVERGEYPGMKWSKTDRVRVWTQEVPGVGTFFIRASHFSLPEGFKTVWKTQLDPRSAHP
jgi:hypothetical protein